MIEKINFPVDVIVSAAESSPKKNGCYNLFFKINDTVAVKASLIEEIRDGNMYRQEEAAEFGLAPEVYGKVDFDYDGKTFYGYLTEVVSVFEDESEFYESFDDDDISELYEELLRAIGFCFDDCHIFNMGYTEEGKLVCIDFDETNVTDEAMRQKFSSSCINDQFNFESQTI